ncbi:hypothetical protein BJ742DRAFT_797532 [Cladochytrium replicatum]|nr:hypothetical protein BJ742DRAFT_797532 [Cladochytrium replicatum]
MFIQICLVLSSRCTYPCCLFCVVSLLLLSILCCCPSHIECSTPFIWCFFHIPNVLMWGSAFHW